jgi:hypothetical protein
MRLEMDKIYEAKSFEDKIYQKWEESGYFNPDNLDLPENAPNYSMVLPHQTLLTSFTLDMLQLLPLRIFLLDIIA